jgi:hypothetical protein
MEDRGDIFTFIYIHSFSFCLSRNELHHLLDKPQLQGIPVLVLGNKRDLAGALDEKQLIERM